MGAARVRRGWVAALVLITVLAGSVSACGDDSEAKEDFVDHMVATSQTPSKGPDGDRWRRIYGCTYEEIADTPLLDQMLDLGRGDQPSPELSAEVSKVLADCLTQVPPPVTTPQAPENWDVTTTVAPG